MTERPDGPPERGHGPSLFRPWPLLSLQLSLLHTGIYIEALPVRDAVQSKCIHSSEYLICLRQTFDWLGNFQRGFWQKSKCKSRNLWKEVPWVHMSSVNMKESNRRTFVQQELIWVQFKVGAEHMCTWAVAIPESIGRDLRGSISASECNTEKQWTPNERPQSWIKIEKKLHK